MKKTPRILYISVIVAFSTVSGAAWEIPNFIADTVIVAFPGDSLFIEVGHKFTADQRVNGGQHLAVGTRKKWYYLPVDQFYWLKMPLNELCNWYLGDSLSADSSNRLIFDNLTFWYDRNGYFGSGREKLNGYTYLVDGSGQIIRDWQWDFTIKKQKKVKQEEAYSDLLEKLLSQQKNSLTSSEPDEFISRFPYRRELNPWVDFIIMPDGFIIDVRLKLLFPMDEAGSWQHGIRGVYYRRTEKFESAAVGGLDQQWYFRKNDDMVWRCGITGRFGFNSYQADYFDTIHWKNIFMVHAGFTGSLEYRPRYLRGLHAAVGLYLQVNALPEFVDFLEGGVLVTVGVNLP